MSKSYLDQDGLIYLMTLIKGGFVPKDGTKGLSANDFTAELKTKLEGVASGATKTETSANNGRIKINGTETAIYSLPNAAADTLGGVKVGDNLSVSNGVISLSASNVIAALGFSPVTIAEVNSAVANAAHLKRSVVTALPLTTEADLNTIYMVLNENAEDGNNYSEWMLVENNWEQIGGSNVDLSGYVKTSDIASIANTKIEEIFNA